MPAAQEAALLSTLSDSPVHAAGKRKVVAEGSTDQLQGLRLVVTGYVNGVPTTALQLIEGVREHDLAQGGLMACWNTSGCRLGALTVSGLQACPRGSSDGSLRASWST